MKILLTGPSGQVGAALLETLPGLGKVVAASHARLDLASPDSIRRAVRDARPEAIVNAGAYTAVDKAESERDAAFAVNAAASGVLAEEAKRSGTLLVHYSTDYVFDGTKAAPYVEDDAPNPLNVYGKSKLAGERAIVGSGCRYLVLRTSWVYGPRGRNFYLGMLRLAKERPELKVVDDQLGAPTSSLEIARATALLIGKGAEGLYHMTAAGETTWCGFARAILSGAGITTPVVAIRTEDYPTPARRPRNSRLDCSRLRADFGLSLAPWEKQLAEVTLAAS